MNYDRDPNAVATFSKLWKLHKEIEAMPRGNDRRDASIAFAMTLVEYCTAELVACLPAKSILRLCFMAKEYRISKRDMFDLLAGITPKRETT